MPLVEHELRLILDFELYKGSVDSSKKDEGELTAAKRLLCRVAKEHKNTVDVVVYDNSAKEIVEQVENYVENKGGTLEA